MKLPLFGLIVTKGVMWLLAVPGKRCPVGAHGSSCSPRFSFLFFPAVLQVCEGWCCCPILASLLGSSGLSPPWVINICSEVKEEESTIQHHASSQGLLKVRENLPASSWLLCPASHKMTRCPAGLVSFLQGGIRSWQPTGSLICGGNPGLMSFIPEGSPTSPMAQISSGKG